MACKPSAKAEEGDDDDNDDDNDDDEDDDAAADDDDVDGIPKLPEILCVLNEVEIEIKCGCIACNFAAHLHSPSSWQDSRG